MRSFGITTWDEKNGRPQQQQDEVARLPFLRLTEGNNLLRVVTPPSVYWNIRFEDGKSQFGTRVNCSDKILDESTKSECPTFQAGYKPKKRYIVGVIDRSDNQVKLFDMSVLVYESLQNLKEDPEYGTPNKFDINVKFNKKASTPQGFYAVIPRPPRALSESDLELIRSVGEEVIEQNLVRLCTPPSVERVSALLKKLGWDGLSKKEAPSTSEVQDGIGEVSEDDYSFDREDLSA